MKDPLLPIVVLRERWQKQRIILKGNLCWSCTNMKNVKAFYNNIMCETIQLLVFGKLIAPAYS